MISLGPRTAHRQRQEARIAVLAQRYKHVRLDEPDPEESPPPPLPKPVRYRVLCVETGQKFRYVKDAAASVGRTHNALLSAMHDGTVCGGYHFRDLRFPDTWPELKLRRDRPVVCLNADDSPSTYPSAFAAAKHLTGIRDGRNKTLRAAAMAIYRALADGRLALGMRWRRA